MQDKIGLYLDRLYLLQQRVRRNRMFSRPALETVSGPDVNYCEVQAKVSHCSKELQNKRARRLDHCLQSFKHNAVDTLTISAGITLDAH